MKFSVPEMSCGHCTSTIEKSIKSADATARVDCDLATRTVSVVSELPASTLTDILKNAGYDNAVV